MVQLSYFRVSFVDHSLGSTGDSLIVFGLGYVFGWQYFFILKPIQARIQRDIDMEKQHRPAWEIRAEQFRRGSTLDDERADERAISEALKQDSLDDVDVGDQLDDIDYDDDDDEDEF